MQTTTAQMIEDGLTTDEQVIEAMRTYRAEYADHAPPNWIGDWFRAAWHLLRSRGWSVAALGAALERAA